MTSEPRFDPAQLVGRTVIHAFRRRRGDLDLADMSTACGIYRSGLGPTWEMNDDLNITCASCLRSMERQRETARGEGVPRHRAATILADLRRAGYTNIKSYPCGVGVRFTATGPHGGGVGLRKQGEIADRLRNVWAVQS